MSITYVSADLRRFVIARADGLCEYCLIHSDDTFLGCQIDHIISEKHGGLTQENNLAYCCAACNLHKGSDIGSVAPGRQRLVRFFNPRRDRWSKHFALRDDTFLLPLSVRGEVTARILAFNEPDRLEERKALQAEGLYPTTLAWKRMRGRSRRGVIGLQ